MNVVDAQNRRDSVVLGLIAALIVATFAIISFFLVSTEVGSLVYAGGIGTCGVSILLLAGSMWVIGALDRGWSYLRAPHCGACSARTRPLEPGGRDSAYRYLPPGYRVCRQCGDIYVPPGMMTPVEIRWEREREGEGEVFLDTRWSVDAAKSLDGMVERLGIGKAEFTDLVQAVRGGRPVMELPPGSAVFVQQAGLVDESGRVDKTIMPELLSLAVLRSMDGDWNSAWMGEATLTQLVAAGEVRPC